MITLSLFSKPQRPYLIIKLLCHRKFISGVRAHITVAMCPKMAQVSNLPGYFYLLSAGFILAIQIQYLT